ncbi:MAG: hypothetical protein K2I42_06475 [Anaeroplasmataceae bacterium]|nr:hypothetical protein [Anaeroplasmataceae bacterium]
MNQNAKKNRQMIHISFIFINFLFIGIIFGVIFILIKQLYPILELSDSIHDSYFYSYNYNEVDKRYSEDQKKDACYYYIDYVEVDEEYLPIIYLNEAAIKNGLPFLYNTTILFFPLNQTNLPKNKIVTNQTSLTTSSIAYLDYFKDKSIKSYFLDLNVEFPYICLTDEFEDVTLAIYTSYPKHNNLDSSWYNTAWANSICQEGKNLKKVFFNYNEFQMKLFVILSILPILFTTIAVGNYYAYYISSQKDDIIINHIYYASKKKLFWKYFMNLAILAMPSSILAILLMWSIILHQFAFLIGIGILCTLLLEGISILFIVKKQIKKNLNYNLWRQIHD